MKFPYLKLPSTDPGQKWVKRPLIPVKLIGPKNVWQGDALVDSGADRSLFSLEIGKFLGLDFSHSKGELFGGIGQDKVLVYTREIYLEVLDLEKKIKISAGFMSHANIAAILGQEGFFDNFSVKFERDNDSIEITVTK